MKRVLLAFFLLIFSAGSGFAILPGPITDFFTPRPNDTTAILFGTRGVPKKTVNKIERLAYRNADYLKQKDTSRTVEVYADTAFPQELFTRRSLVLMGTPKSHALLAEWRGFFPFILRDYNFNISGRKLYQGDDLMLSCIFPNPLNAERYVWLLVGTEPWAQPSLADWPGDYDYYVSQRHSFRGWHLNRGKFQKNSSLWSQELSQYDRSPHDTASLVSLVYPNGRVWYPSRWEEDSLWAVPIAERIRLLAALQDLIASMERSLGLKVYGDIDFQLSDRYPSPSAYDPMGQVFLRAHPAQMDSLVFLSWGAPLTRVLFPCSDAPLDWELFAHRYFLTQSFFKWVGKRPGELRQAGGGRFWAEAVAAGDSTYLSLFNRLMERGHSQKIGEALDSVLAGGKKYSFRMREFVEVLGRIVPDTLIKRLARLPLRPSPYGRQPRFDLGMEKLGELFLKAEVVVDGLPKGSRAAAAGLMKGDKIVAVDGLPTARNRSRAFLAWLGKKKGQTLTLVIERKGVKRTLAIPLG